MHVIFFLKLRCVGVRHCLGPQHHKTDVEDVAEFRRLQVRLQIRLHNIYAKKIKRAAALLARRLFAGGAKLPKVTSERLIQT